MDRNDSWASRRAFGQMARAIPKRKKMVKANNVSEHLISVALYGDILPLTFKLLLNPDCIN